jgi:hypothetical protein
VFWPIACGPQAISQDDVPDSADFEIFFKVFWRGCRIVSLLGYPKDGSVGSSGSGGENPGRFFFFGTKSRPL